MRTTVTIDDALLAHAKDVAARTGRTVGQVIEDSLRETFARRESPAKPRPFPVFGRGGTLPGVDISDTAALLDLMEEGRVDAMR
ncbi:MAG: DUF2191 domain-containing protein [Actinomycetota bacterium]